MSGQYIIFQLNNDYLGIKLDHVREIININTVFKIPNTPDFIEGLINLRDKVYTLFDLKKFFKLPHLETDLEESTAKILIVTIGSLSVGLKVDIVNEIAFIDEVSLTPPSECVTFCYKNHVESVAKILEKEILILDVATIVDTKESQTEAYISEKLQLVK